MSCCRLSQHIELSARDKLIASTGRMTLPSVPVCHATHVGVAAIHAWLGLARRHRYGLLQRCPRQCQHGHQQAAASAALQEAPEMHRASLLQVHVQTHWAAWLCNSYSGIDVQLSHSTYHAAKLALASLPARVRAACRSNPGHRRSKAVLDFGIVSLPKNTYDKIMHRLLSSLRSGGLNSICAAVNVCGRQKNKRAR